MSGYMVFAWLTGIFIGLQAYHYVLYPAVLGVLVVLRGRRVPVIAPDRPSATLIISAYNEAGVIGQKIENSLALDPPPLEILIVADGSDDSTEVMAAQAAKGHDRVKVLFEPARRGKAAAMNRGAMVASGDILVFSDANAFYTQSAIGALADGFADPNVSVVSGSKTIRDSVDEPAGLLGASDGLYWRYETFIRRCESDLGATVASVGEILAVRRSDWREIPAGTVNDDAWMTMTNLARGRDVRFAHDAVSWERPSGSAVEERTRRRRINAGRIKLIGQPGVWPWRRPAVLLAFVSHKVLRLALPILMIGGVLVNIVVVAIDPERGVFWVTLALQLAVFALAAAGYMADRTGRRWKLAHLAFHIVQSNLTVLGAIADIARGQQFTVWKKPSR
ncbi:MAG: glycosyltransferase family 2 protein [Pseudorhodobacter sp.]|nr:glycosyltransferase family 2 protein [Pseudorhodobacter sp.]